MFILPLALPLSLILVRRSTTLPASTVHLIIFIREVDRPPADGLAFAGLRALGFGVGRFEDEAFFHPELDNQALPHPTAHHISVKTFHKLFPPLSIASHYIALTSKFENISSSKNSATPKLLALASAKATPTCLVAPPSFAMSLRAMTSGEEILSVLEKRRSSSCWMLPGEAYESYRCELTLSYCLNVR